MAVVTTAAASMLHSSPPRVGEGPLGRLRAQQSLDSGVDVPAGGDERLQVGLVVDEPHGAKLVKLLLELHLWALCLVLEEEGESKKKKKQ